MRGCVDVCGLLKGWGGKSRRRLMSRSVACAPAAAWQIRGKSAHSLIPHGMGKKRGGLAAGTGTGSETSGSRPLSPWPMARPRVQPQPQPSGNLSHRQCAPAGPAPPNCGAMDVPPSPRRASKH